MKHFFKKEDAYIFVDTHKAYFQTEGLNAYNLILSPSLYWIKKLDLELSKRELKTLLPSVFDTHLPQGKYRYMLLEQEESFYAVAYDESYIFQILQHLGIDQGIIKNMYFAQELCVAQLPCSIDQQHTLIKEQGVVVVIPSYLLQDKPQELDFAKLQRPKQPLVFRSYKVDVDEKTLLKLSLIFLLFGFLLIAEWWHYNHLITQLQKSQQEFAKHYNLMPTMMQNRALLEELQTKKERQEGLIKLLENTLALPLYRYGIYAVEYQRGVLRLYLHQKMLQDLSQELKKRGLYVAVQKYKNGFVMEIRK